jgi:hypothetical protein
MESYVPVFEKEISNWSRNNNRNSNNNLIECSLEILIIFMSFINLEFQSLHDRWVVHLLSEISQGGIFLPIEPRICVSKEDLHALKNNTHNKAQAAFCT